MTTLRMALACVIAVAGCGGGGTAADSGPLPFDSGAPPDSGPSADAGADASTADGGPTADSGPDAGGDAGPLGDGGGARVVISGFDAYGNCMPIVAPDPIRSSWTATVNGATGGTAMLTEATLTIIGSSTVVQHLTVDVPAITLTGGSGSAEQRKVSADTNPSTACGELCGGASAHLELTFSIDGASVTATSDGSYSCVY